MHTVAIVGSGPMDHLPNLKQYENEVDCWIGADRGAFTLLENGITINHAVGDFDSIDQMQKEMITEHALHMEAYPVEKNETDLEIALQKAFSMKPANIYLFGVTGGRLDHALINMQLLHTIVHLGIRGIMIDKWNQVELTQPGTYTVHKNEQYPYISFVPLTQYVKHLSLSGFYYTLKDHYLSWGSTRCISNELLAEQGSYSYEEGVLLLIKSRDLTDSDSL